MRNWRIILSGAILPLALSACGGDHAADEPKAVQASGQKITLQPSIVTDFRDVSAQISTVDEAQVVARIPGILTSLSVREGDFVKAGQVIGRIVDSQLGYQAGAYGAQAAAAQAQSANAQAELARIRYLHENGVYSKARLEQAQAAASAAKAQVVAAKSQQQAVQAVSGQGAVVAPASGRVLMANVPAGSPVAPGMLIAAITAGPTVLKLELPESLAGQVASGSTVTAEIPGKGQVSGKVVKLYPSVMGGQVRADVSVSGLDSTLIGRRIPAKVGAGERQALIVPKDYVMTAYGIDTVWVVAKDGSAASVPVQTAPSADAAMIEILSGVQAGDTLLKKAAQ